MIEILIAVVFLVIVYFLQRRMDAITRENNDIYEDERRRRE